jgi:hypothetical protein
MAVHSSGRPPDLGGLLPQLIQVHLLFLQSVAALVSTPGSSPTPHPLHEEPVTLALEKLIPVDAPAPLPTESVSVNVKEPLVVPFAQSSVWPPLSLSPCLPEVVVEKKKKRKKSFVKNLKVCGAPVVHVLCPLLPLRASHDSQLNDSALQARDARSFACTSRNSTTIASSLPPASSRDTPPDLVHVPPSPLDVSVDEEPPRQVAIPVLENMHEFVGKLIEKDALHRNHATQEMNDMMTPVGEPKVLEPLVAAEIDFEKEGRRETRLHADAQETLHDLALQFDQGKEAVSRLSSAALVFVPTLPLDATLQSHGDLEAGEEADTTLVVFNEDDANESEAEEEASWFDELFLRQCSNEEDAHESEADEEVSWLDEVDEVKMWRSGNGDEYDVIARAWCRELGRKILEEGKGVDVFKRCDGTLVAWGRIILKTVKLSTHGFSEYHLLWRICLRLATEEGYLIRGKSPPSTEAHLLWLCEQVHGYFLNRQTCRDCG